MSKLGTFKILSVLSVFAQLALSGACFANEEIRPNQKISLKHHETEIYRTDARQNVFDEIQRAVVDVNSFMGFYKKTLPNIVSFNVKHLDYRKDRVTMMVSVPGVPMPDQKVVYLIESWNMNDCKKPYDRLGIRYKASFIGGPDGSNKYLLEGAREYVVDLCGAEFHPSHINLTGQGHILAGNSPESFGGKAVRHNFTWQPFYMVDTIKEMVRSYHAGR